MQHQSTPAAQSNAHILRTAMTDSERKLWSGLRREQLGVKFRRQHPLGPYVADFACLEPKLVVELDGSQHAQQLAHDRRRDDFFAARGFAVMRFPTDAPLRNLAGVRTAILEQLQALGAAPIPAFPRSGKGGAPNHAFAKRGEGVRPHPGLPPEGEGVRPHPGLPPAGEGVDTRSFR